MQKFFAIKYFSFVFCIFLVFAELTSSVPFYSDYESNEVADSNKGKDYQIKNRSVDIRDLYELLLKKDALDDQLGQSHIISRKSNRSPSLRLRFGKKRDPYFANPSLIGHPVPMLEDKCLKSKDYMTARQFGGNAQSYSQMRTKKYRMNAILQLYRK